MTSKNLLTFICCFAIAISSAQSKVENAANDATNVVRTADAVAKGIEVSKPLIDKSAKGFKEMFKKKDKAENNSKTDSSAFPGDISGVWSGKLMATFPYELHLTLNPDSTTWSGTSYFFHQGKLYGIYLDERNSVYIQAKVKAYKEKSEYIIVEEELINGPKNILGYKLHKLIVELDDNKNGKKKLKGIDKSYVAIEPGTEYLGKVKLEQVSNTLNKSQEKAVSDVDHPDIQITDLKFTSKDGKNTLGYMGQGSVSFSIKNNGFVESPVLQLGIFLSKPDLVKVNEVSGMLNQGIMAGGYVKMQIDIEAIDRILDAEFSIEIQVSEKQTNKTVGKKESIKIPIQQ